MSRNPWVAVDTATDRVAHARRLRAAHERAFSGDVGPGEVRKVVFESWRRSLAAGVEPGAAGAPLTMDRDEVEVARASSPLASAIGAILMTLSRLDGDARHVVAISDAQANLLWVRGHRGALERAQETMRFAEGASWSESAVGTNAVGTAAALDHEVQIFSAEHLVEAVHGWTCSAAPIHDPISGALLGVVDLTANLRTAHPHTLSLAVLAARAAESTLYVRELKAAVRLLERWQSATAGTRTANALLDRYGRVIATRSAAGLPLKMELDGAVDGAISLPDGRVGVLEELEGGGRILWLWRQRPSPLDH